MGLRDLVGLAMVVAGALLACNKGGGASGSGSAPAPAGSGDAQPAAAAGEKPIILTAMEITDEYKANEVRADGKYKGKRVAVVGQVGDIKKDLTDTIYVTVGTGTRIQIPMVQAYFSDAWAQKAASLNKGDTVVVVCRCEGLMLNVLLKDCSITDLPNLKK